MTVNEVTHHTLSIRERRVHYITAGETGPTVLLLHGGGIDSAGLSWKYTIPYLASHCRVIAPDWPGYGESELPVDSWTLEHNIRFLQEFMDALGLESAALAGVSLGGGTALGFALAHPRRVSRLVLIDSYGLQRKVAFQWLSYQITRSEGLTRVTYDWLVRSRSLVRWTLGMIMANKASITEDLVDEVLEICRRPQIYLPFLQLQQNEIFPDGLRSVFIDRIGELAMPVCLIHGDKDNLVPLACAQEAARIQPAAVLHVLPNCGHWPHRDQADLFNQTLLGCLLGQS